MRRVRHVTELGGHVQTPAQQWCIYMYSILEHKYNFRALILESPNAAFPLCYYPYPKLFKLQF